MLRIRGNVIFLPGISALVGGALITPMNEWVAYGMATHHLGPVITCLGQRHPIGRVHCKHTCGK